MYENSVGVNTNLDEASRLNRVAAAQEDEHGTKGLERAVQANSTIGLRNHRRVHYDGIAKTARGAAQTDRQP
jgi:hypothetical protein